MYDFNTVFAKTKLRYQTHNLNENKDVYNKSFTNCTSVLWITIRKKSKTNKG